MIQRFLSADFRLHLLTPFECGLVRAAIYGYTVDKSIGFAMIDAKKAVEGRTVTVGQNESPAVITRKCWL